MDEWLNGLVNEWMSEWMGEWMGEWMDGLVYGYIYGWLICLEIMNGSLCSCIDEHMDWWWMNVWMNVWIDDRWTYGLIMDGHKDWCMDGQIVKQIEWLNEQFNRYIGK